MPSADRCPEWPPFEEVPAALRAIRAAGWRTAILSNTDPELLAASVARIGVEVDVRITVAEAGQLQARARALGTVLRAHRRRDRARNTSTSRASLFHDIEPASALGLRAVWINRNGEQSTVPRGAELPDLAGLEDVLDRLVPALVDG